MKSGRENQFGCIPYWKKEKGVFNSFGKRKVFKFLNIAGCMEDIKLKILKEMQNPEMYVKDLIDYVERNVPDAFNICCRKNLSINQWKPDATFGNQVNQKTVLLTVRMFDLWETALIDVLNNKLSKKFNGVKVEHTHDSKGDLTIVLPDGEKWIWEIKTTQGKDSFTGATHSASKYADYILISYNINKDIKLKRWRKNNRFITELAIFVWDKMEAKWIGKPSKNSSWTTLKIPIEINAERPEIVVIGSLIPKQKWCEISRQKL